MAVFAVLHWSIEEVVVVAEVLIYVGLFSTQVKSSAGVFESRIS